MGQIKTQADWKWVIVAIATENYGDGEYSIVDVKGRMMLSGSLPAEETMLFNSEAAANEYLPTAKAKHGGHMTDFTVEPWQE